VLLLHVAVAFALTGQGWPQPPQFFGSVLVSTQTPLHSIYGRLQAKSHMPMLHKGVAFGGGMQTLPQVPQLSLLVILSTQEPLQLSVPVGQPVPQVPPAHTSPPVQALLQSPQCAWSDFRSTHSPLQSV
jgi:hypothetical protein